MASKTKRTAVTESDKTRAKYRRLADRAAKELAPYDRQLQTDVARLLAVQYRMIEAIIRPV